MLTRRESLQRLLRFGLLVPLGLTACTSEGGPVVEDELPLDVLAPGSDVHIVHVDPETARQHMAAMNRCLAERGVSPPAGPFRIRLDGPPPPVGAGAPRKVLFIAHEGAPPPEHDDAAPVDEATREAFAACLAQIGTPAAFRP
jgi:hypothetical protein